MGFEYSENRVGTPAGYQDVQNAQSMRDIADMFETRRGVDDALEQMRAAAQLQSDTQTHPQTTETTQTSQYTAEQQVSFSKTALGIGDWIDFVRKDLTDGKA